MKRALKLIFLIFCFYNFSSCKSIHDISEIPSDTYLVESRQYARLNKESAVHTKQVNIKVDIQQLDSLLILVPHDSTIKPIEISLANLREFKIQRRAFDMDILTIPFKIRLSTEGFPQQFNSNFSAGIYLGQRKDYYYFSSSANRSPNKVLIRGIGYGYGGFLGLGGVTMNPFVTNEAIDYEYDGLVINGGLAGILDVKRFNIGIAAGSDFLLDKNRASWIYQGKPWFGIIFGLSLN